MMDSRLPLGSICLLKFHSDKIIVTGYLSLGYSNEVKQYDYCGLRYPMGMMSSDIIKFNKSDIKKVIFEGYSDEVFNSFSKALDSYKGEEKITSSVVSNNKLKFDANGVVVSDGTEPFEETKIDTNLKFNANGVVVSDGTEPFEETKIDTNLKFDANGVVVSDGTEPFEETKIDTNLKFDANGVVVSDGTETIDLVPTYEFDSNGTVVGEKMVPREQTNPFKQEYPESVKQESRSVFKNIQFDNNGVVIAVEE